PCPRPWLPSSPGRHSSSSPAPWSSSATPGRSCSACRGIPPWPFDHAWAGATLASLAMPSFDIVSQVQQNEVDNAFNQAQKELAQRFDFKDTETTMERAPDAITIRSGSED